LILFLGSWKNSLTKSLTNIFINILVKHSFRLTKIL